jgi:hypothetical protein
MSDKIHTQHLARKAVLYVRQSSPHQVLHNQESQRLQYAMRQRLELLGWDEIEVKILRVDSEERKIHLSLKRADGTEKQTRDDVWTRHNYVAKTPMDVEGESDWDT